MNKQMSSFLTSLAIFLVIYIAISTAIVILSGNAGDTVISSLVISGVIALVIFCTIYYFMSNRAAARRS